MGIYERDYKTSKFTDNLQNNALVMLITINLVVFVLFQFVEVFYYFSISPKEAAHAGFMNNFYNNLALPGTFKEFIHKPWTLLTSMFYHQGIWHILGNMLWLWMFGYIFHDLTGNRKIIPLFIWGALGGAIAFMLAYNFIPTLRVHNANMVGASAGIMAIVVATTMLAPGYRIFPMLNGGIPLWVLTLIYLIMDLALIPVENTGGHIAHLAGGFTGFLFIFFMRQGFDWSVGINSFFDWVNNLFNPDKPTQKAKEELFYKSERKPFTRTTNLSQQRIDEILDKINQHGFHSLTIEEKELLKKASKEDLK
jgi:membrane associated rhomboid family serine protease